MRALPSASLGEGTLVCLCYAGIVEPVERHFAVLGGIQKAAPRCSFVVELRVSAAVCGSSCAGRTFSREKSRLLATRGTCEFREWGFGDLGVPVQGQTLPLRAIGSAWGRAAETVVACSRALCTAPGIHGEGWMVQGEGW
jgi:hypothetical protein